MATYSINQMKKEIKKLEKLNIVGEKAILNVKVLDLKKLKEQEKIKNALKDIYEGKSNDVHLNESELKGALKEMAIYVNDIASGFSNAINESLKSERLKTELITNVSHDIKTPLTSIINYVDLLKKENIQDEKLKEILINKFNQKLDNEMLLKFSQGSISRAINIIENKEIYEKVEEIISNIHKKDIIEIIKMSEIIYKSKEIINDILENINIQLMELSKNSYAYLECIDIVENTKKRLKMNANYDMCIDNLLFNMWEEVN